MIEKRLKVEVTFSDCGLHLVPWDRVAKLVLWMRKAGMGYAQ